MHEKWDKELADSKKYIPLPGEEILKPSTLLMIPFSSPVANSRKVMDYMCDLITDGIKNDKKLLTDHLAHELKTLFGKHVGSLRGEFFQRIWTLDYLGLSYNIYTAKGKGTSIELQGISSEEIRNGAYDERIIAFLDELYTQINNIQPLIPVVNT